MRLIKKDYSLYKYGTLCQALTESDYQNITIQECLETPPGECPERFILLRHDVDRQPKLSLELAELENQFGLRSTYYFRTHPVSYKPRIIQKIHQLGHEIGYHYETLSDSNGDVGQALALFSENLTKMRDLVPVKTAAMHGRPLSHWDNRLIWKEGSLEQFDLIGEAYLSLDYNKIDYFSDTGRTWHPSRYNVRDKTSQHVRYVMETTDDLIDHIRSGISDQICILTHPERWPSKPMHWIYQTGIDLALNQVKVLYKSLIIR
ncbi:MAG: hypothetical protein WBB69_17000 [Anaerolineales bacterium]